MKRLSQIFFTKRGEISKTAIFLSLATFILLFLWPFQSLFAGMTFFGWFIVPEFSAGAATAVMGSLAALYAVNHGWVNKQPGEELSPDDMVDLREKLDSFAQTISGNTDDD